MEKRRVSGRDRNRFVSGRPAWLRKALSRFSARCSDIIPLEMLIALMLGIAVMFVFAGGAQASPPTLIPDGQFEAAQALGVAVDQSTSESGGDVYVAGFPTPNAPGVAPPFVAGGVNKFDASGRLLSPPSPFGVSPPSPFESFGYAGYSGAAVSPVTGDVYALDGLTSEILKFDPVTGEPLGSFTVAASGNFTGLVTWTVVGIAADAAGDVYVPVVPENRVVEYGPTGAFIMALGGKVDKTTGGNVCNAASGDECVSGTAGSSGGQFRRPSGVSVDPKGNVWVADVGNERIVELSPSGVFVGEIGSEGLRSIAVGADGDVFASVLRADSCGTLRPPCPHLVEYSGTGVQLADVGAGVLGAETAKTVANGEFARALPEMVAVSDASGNVYVTEFGTGEHSRVFVFTPPVAPKLESEVALEIGTSTAKLGAEVNPGGIGAFYRFEYGTTTAYGNAVPFPEGDTGGGFHPRSVWASASGLLPGTTYHYRIVVTGALGNLVGEDRTFTTQTAAQSSCPNEQFRTGFSANLPDCRAYELVTPPNKTSSEPDPAEGQGAENVEKTLLENNAAVDGNRFSFVAEDVFPGSNSAAKRDPYVATRRPGGWSSESVIPPTNHYAYKCIAPVPGYSPDMSKEILRLGREGYEGGCGDPEPELVRGEARGVENLFVRDNTNGSYQLVSLTPPGVPPADATPLGQSADLTRVVFQEQAKLTENALEGVADVYEWSGGVVRLVTVLPGDTPVAGAFAGLSKDGSRVFFTYAGDLYARVNGASTIQVDASQAGGAGGGGEFLAASADGSRVLFSDEAPSTGPGLTGDTTPGSGPNLYSYDFATGRLSHLDASQAGGAGGGGAFVKLSGDGSHVLFSDEAPSTGPGLTGETVAGSGKNLYSYALANGGLTDLTPGAHAELLGVIGAGEDASHVYFEAEGALAAGATQGQHNVYVWHAGTGTTFLPGGGGGQVSKDGRFLAFASGQRLTGYDNTDINTGKPDGEVYEYDAASNSLACASCDPSGAPPAGGPRWGGEFSPPNLSEDGRVFFDTTESLLPADTNGKRDVYEFEPDGVGSCSDPGGCVSLISTGTGSQDTWFIAASPSGDDVFLREYQKLVPADKQEEARTIYDVRVNGGIPEPETPPECTTADACRTAPAPSPSIFGAPATQTFSGAGNLAPAPPVSNPPMKCKKGYVKRKGKCVKAKKARKARNIHRKGRR
jgi:NHL repeat